MNQEEWQKLDDEKDKFFKKLRRIKRQGPSAQRRLCHQFGFSMEEIDTMMARMMNGSAPDDVIYAAKKDRENANG